MASESSVTPASSTTKPPKVHTSKEKQKDSVDTDTTAGHDKETDQQEPSSWLLTSLMGIGKQLTKRFVSLSSSLGSSISDISSSISEVSSSSSIKSGSSQPEDTPDLELYDYLPR